MDRKNIEKIAESPDDRLLLAKIWDKIQAGLSRNIPAASCFLSPREQEMARCLLGSEAGLCFFGGYDDAERKMAVYLPEYLDSSHLWSGDSPISCLRADFYRTDSPSHRDFLGALMGAGVARETIGDICVGNGFCTLFVSREIAPYLLQNFCSAGRAALHLSSVPLPDAVLPQPEVQEIRATVASLRLDSLVSAGFRISRGLAAQHIAAGKAAVDGLPCEKPDRPVAQGAKISLRGLGKMQLLEVGGQTKKGRISVVIHRYL